ncbi:hypothetical protein D3C85_977460 [compost metagenome]
MSDQINLLAKSIEVDTLQKTVVSISRNLAEVTLDNQTIRTAYAQLNEDSTKRLDELSKANVALVLEVNEVKACQGRQQTIIQNMEDDLVGLRHQRDRREIIWNFAFPWLRDGMAIKLPHHESLGKIKKADLKLNPEHMTAEGVLDHIDNLYQQVDNPELRRLLRE